MSQNNLKEQKLSTDFQSLLNSNEFLETIAIKWNPAEMWALDQTQLPEKEIWLELRSLEDFIKAIKNLSIRGAPLIGVSAALFLAKLAKANFDKERLVSEALEIRKARPTAVNLMVCIDRMIQAIHYSESANDILREAKSIFYEDQALCLRISENGSKLIQDGDAVVTHCNTGALATAGMGTALGVLKQAFKSENKTIHVYVDETRPLLQGGRLTAWELEKLEIPYTLITDSMAGFLMKNKKIQKAIVGCDRIALNGDFANKIGTYSLAVNCYYHQIPFYVAGPYTTIDFNCLTGDQIPIEERQREEILGFKQNEQQMIWAPRNAKVFNPSFDITSAKLVSAWILDSNIYTQDNIHTLEKTC